MFRNIQLEIAKFSRLSAGFPDLALSEADRCMVVLRNLDVEVKKYVLLHARVDSMEQLETALKFYDANLKILTFQEKDGKGAKEHANALTFDDKGKGKKGDKGKEKGKGKDKDGKNGKGKDKDSKDKGKGGAAKDSGKGSGSNKDKDKEKEERLKNIKCYNCDQHGHYSNRCPKPKREKASAAALLEPQVAAASVEPQLFAVAAASVEPQLFAVALELGCPVVELDSEDGSDLSREDWEDFVASYECAWSEPVVLEGSELVVALEVSEPPVELESSPCDVAVLGEVPEVFEVKAMPKKAGKVKKVVLKSRAQRGIPERVDTALRMLSTKARERKKMGYLVKAINHAMRRKAENQSGPPVRRTWAQHIKDH
eukprot:s13231_g1.t1